MIDEVIAHIGLTAVFLAFAGLMSLIHRVERSLPLALWMIGFLLFAVDAGISAARVAYTLPEYTRYVAWSALFGGALSGLVGTFRSKSS